MKYLLGILLLALLSGCSSSDPIAAMDNTDRSIKKEQKDVGIIPRVVVVGAGLSGLSAALELASGGAEVTVIDMSSVYGGHAPWTCQFTELTSFY